MEAAIAQLGERQTEDLKVPGSIPGLGTFLIFGVWGAQHVLLHAAAHVALTWSCREQPLERVRRMGASMMRQWAHSFHRLLGLVV